MFRMIRIAVFSLIVMSVPICAGAQTYPTPRVVNLDPTIRRIFKKFYVRAYPGGPIQALLTEKFYPIGWSRNGKFAYYSEPADEECGCYFAELAIVDMRTDKVLWQFKNNWEERVAADGSPIEDNIRKLWKRNEKMFADKLREHDITQVARFSLLPPTFRSAGKNYTAKVAVVRGNDEDYTGRVRKLDLKLISPLLGSKSLFTAEYKADEMYGSPLDVAVAGAVKSPYENRVAVIMLSVNRGWEGPPHTTSIQVAGADLAKGFKK
jgi:hypothetical protein